MAYRRKRRRKSVFLRFVVLLAIIGGGYYAYIRYYRQKPSAPEATGPTGSAPATAMLPPGGVLTPPLEPGATTGPAGSEPATSRPSANGRIQPIAMAPIEVPPPDQVEAVYQEGMQAWQAGDLLKARDALNRVLHAAISADRQQQLRDVLGQIADKTIFSPEIVADDPLVGEYIVSAGDTLQKIARQFKVTGELLSSINGGMNMNFIRIGTRLKVVKGPFHATVAKGAFEMHLYLQNVYVRTYRVALGADNSTPTGKWVVRDRLTNPSWVNPRTGQRIAADDPQNPLGEYWIALDGLEGKAFGQSGYGIHGTIDESSIGTNASMGCVRLSSKDIVMAYAMLVPGSTVTIVD